MRQYLKTVITRIGGSQSVFNFKPFQRCLSSSNKEVTAHRNDIFNKEKERQDALVTRVEKMEVNYVGIPEKCKLIMNKKISTPFHCIMHIHEMLKQRSTVALVNGKLWDIHRPLEEDCELDLLHFRVDDPFEVNKAFWRSCSFMLGMIIEKAFKDEFYVELHSWPKPNVRSGSFVYDIDLKIGNWEPLVEELRTLTGMFQKLSSQDLHFERLQIPLSVAYTMFKDNRFKLQQLPSIASHSSDNNSIVVYRLGDHIDISYGPMISNTNQVGKVAITAAHQIDTEDGLLYRFQGLALPKQLPLNTFAFQIILDRAKELNTNGLPSMKEKIAA